MVIDSFYAEKMAGLEEYESVYRGRPTKSWEMGTPYPQRYHGREVIRPLEVPVIHPLAEDNPPAVEEGEFVGNILILCKSTVSLSSAYLSHCFKPKLLSFAFKFTHYIL